MLWFCLIPGLFFFLKKTRLSCWVQQVLEEIAHRWGAVRRYSPYNRGRNRRIRVGWEEESYVSFYSSLLLEESPCKAPELCTRFRSRWSPHLGGHIFSSWHLSAHSLPPSHMEILDTLLSTSGVLLCSTDSGSQTDWGVNERKLRCPIGTVAFLIVGQLHLPASFPIRHAG